MVVNKRFFINSINFIFFLLVGCLAACLYFNVEIAVNFFRIGSMLLFILLYFLQTKESDQLYLFSILCCFISMFFFFEESIKNLKFASILFLTFEIATIWIISKKTKRVRFIPIIIATIPFLSLFFYVICLTQNSLKDILYPAIINSVLISITGGLVISNYVMEDDVKNTWLLISMLLSVLLFFIFMIEHFYLNIKIFKPLRTLTFFIGQYLFMRYMLQSENQTKIDFPSAMIDESESK